MEFPHLVRLIEENQFDTIYHEHFSYFSFLAVENDLRGPWPDPLRRRGVADPRRIAADLRPPCRGRDEAGRSGRVGELRDRERAAGLDRMTAYAAFAEQVEETKRKLLEFLIRLKREGKSICGYGAPGKGNTLLNYCGIRTDFLDYTVDRNPYKQGKFPPGTHIPIFPPEKIRETRPDYVLILPWNFKDEIMEQLAYVREWGGRFVVPIPEVRICE